MYNFNSAGHHVGLSSLLFALINKSFYVIVILGMLIFYVGHCGLDCLSQSFRQWKLT